MNGALFSFCGNYRYTLQRDFGAGSEQVLFVMLNPSTADQEKDDPTIRKCVGYAKRWGYDKLEVVNLFAIRATDPSKIWSHYDPVGLENDEFIKTALGRSELVVCAWGVPSCSRMLERSISVYGIIAEAGHAPKCLKRTKDGFPSHPLYLPYALEPTYWGLSV